MPGKSMKRQVAEIIVAAVAFMVIMGVIAQFAPHYTGSGGTGGTWDASQNVLRNVKIAFSCYIKLDSYGSWVEWTTYDQVGLTSLDVVQPYLENYTISYYIVKAVSYHYSWWASVGLISQNYQQSIAVYDGTSYVDIEFRAGSHPEEKDISKSVSNVDPIYLTYVKIRLWAGCSCSPSGGLWVGSIVLTIDIYFEPIQG